MDGGGRVETAEVIGRGGTDVIVAGSALYRADDMAAEVERIRAIANAARVRDPRRDRRLGRTTVRALLQRVTRAEVRVDGRAVGRDRTRPRSCCSASGTTTTRRPPTRWRAGSASCGSSRMTRGGRTARCSTSAARRSSSASSRSTRTRAAGGGPGFTDAAPPELARPLWLRVADGDRGAGRADRAGRVRGGDGGRARERRPVHDLARHRPTARPGHDEAGRERRDRLVRAARTRLPSGRSW